MRTILIDDERDSIESLQSDLQAYCPEVDIIGTYSNPEEGLAQIRALQPDLVFLDIEMPRMNGFDLLNALGEINFDVIFVTAYDEFAIKAFNFNATDYLLKPVMKSKLIDGVQKVRDRQSHSLDSQDFAALLNNIKIQYQHNLETIALPTAEGFEFIKINEISYAKSESNYTWVHLIDGRKYLLSKTLKQIESVITFPQFFRSHNSWFANLNHVKKYVRGQGGYLVMQDGTNVPVARSKKEGLINLLVF